MKSEKQLQEEREESLGYDNSKSLNPERDELWAKHDGMTPALAAELLVLAAKLEQERNVWKHEAEILRAELESEHEKAIDWFVAAQEFKSALQAILDAHECAKDSLDEAEQMEAIARRALDSENVTVDSTAEAPAEPTS